MTVSRHSISSLPLTSTLWIRMAKNPQPWRKTISIWTGYCKSCVPGTLIPDDMAIALSIVILNTYPLRENTTLLRKLDVTRHGLAGALERL